jgi:hypothetical protein
MPEKRKKIAIVWVLVFCGVFLAGCGEDNPPGPDEVVVREPVPAHTRDVIVTSDDGALPEGCRPRPVAELVIRFVDAFNQGRQGELSSAFFVSEGPSPPDFSPVSYENWSWYSSTETGAGGRVMRHFTTSDQGELLRYFAERHRQGESLRLLKLSLTQTGVLEMESNVGFVFVVTREAPDLPPNLGGPARIAYGRGSLNCENLRIFAWRMDMKTQEQRTEREAADWLCVDPPRWKPGEAVVACT